MNEEKMKELLEDEAFVRNLMEQDTPEQVQQFLLNYEIDLSLEEIIKLGEMLERYANGESSLEELSDDDLENVSGGVFGAILTMLTVVFAIGSVGAASWIVNDAQKRARRRW